MPLGRAIRTVLGERGSRLAGRAYRAIFADMGEVARTISREIPAGAHVLDVGGGDGALVDLLLGLRSDIRVTTIDVAPVVGQWIDTAHAARVERLPAMPLATYLALGRPLPDVLLLTDVMHHIPAAERDPFLASIAELMRRARNAKVIVKDVEPGHLRARLGVLSDRYVTGDRGVSLVSRSDLVAAMQRAVGEVRWSETGLFASDPPNYALVFWR
jgi:2-polyprenyl-3-methyl-5-hydroxy-6-metoxy-1,4-benzoquinol methylase